jgi:hypothetical protein
MMTIRKQLTVDAPLERAFRVFTASMGAWWPKEHHIGAAATCRPPDRPPSGSRRTPRGSPSSSAGPQKTRGLCRLVTTVEMSPWMPAARKSLPPDVSRIHLPA